MSKERAETKKIERQINRDFKYDRNMNCRQGIALQNLLNIVFRGKNLIEESLASMKNYFETESYRKITYEKQTPPGKLFQKKIKSRSN